MLNTNLGLRLRQRFEINYQMNVWLILGHVVYSIVICCISVLGSNISELAFSPKSEALDKVNACPVVYTNPYSSNLYVTKPELMSGSVGVGMSNAEWNISICESEFEMGCFAQPYHPGPYEIRLCKDGSYGWKKPFVFLAGWKYETWDDPPHFETEAELIGPWIKSLQSCIDSKFPNTPFVSVDIRANPYTDSFLVLEINGGMGIGFDWVLHYSTKWLSSRIFEGIFTVRGIFRLGDAVKKVLQRLNLVRKWNFEIL